MRKTFYFLLFASAMSYAQSKNQPVVLVDGMLASNAVIAQNKKNIATTKTFKNSNTLPQDLKNFESLASNGLISTTVRENNYDRISLEELNGQFNLDAQNPVYFDDHLITNTKLQIIGDALQHMEVNEKNGKKHLFISTVSKETSKNALK